MFGKFRSFLFVCILTALFLCIGRTEDVYADIASGTSGTCSWVIDDDGILTISPTNGVSGTFISYSPGNVGNGAWSRYETQIQRVVVNSGVKAGAGCFRLFGGLSSCTEMDLRNLDTSDVTDMRQMFNGCSRLTRIYTNGWCTDNVTDMSNMFFQCKQLQSIEGTDWNTTNVGSMYGMFYECNNLVHLDVSKWDVSNVATMQAIFSGCRKLTVLDVSKWNTNNVTNMSNMFNGCSGFESLDVSNWNVENVTSLSSMFAGCSGLTSLDLSGWNTSNVISMASMFRNCDHLAVLNISGFDTNNVTNMRLMFDACRRLQNVSLGKKFSFNNSAIFPVPASNAGATGKWIREDGTYGPFTPEELRDNYISDMAGTWAWELRPCAVFANDGTLYFIRPTLDSRYNSGSVGIVKSVGGDVYTGTIFNVIEDASVNGNRTWSSIKYNVKKVVFVDEIKPINVASWFEGFMICTEIDLKNLNTSNITDFRNTFQSCSSLIKIDLSDCEPMSPVYVNSMFNGCSNLESVDISSINTHGCQAMSFLFSNCAKLKEIVLGDGFTFEGDNLTSSGKAEIPSVSYNFLDRYTGKWIRNDGVYGPYTPSELRDNYTSAMAGTWIWEEKPMQYVVKFLPPDRENYGGTMANQKIKASEAGTLKSNEFYRFNYYFVEWHGDDGKTYEDEAVIPANSFAVGAVLTLTAVFDKNDNHLNFSEGEAEVILHGGEKITLPSLHGGTKYQVYEETPSGWQLKDQSSPSGSIPANDIADARFTNEYVPGTATISLIVQKTLDGRVPADGQFSFELLQDDKVIETVSNNAAGMVTFETLVFKQPGTFTYQIREVRGEEEEINYDSHTETIIITVVDDGKGNLTATSSQGDTIPTFENETKQGSLSFSKEAEGEGTFTFEITLTDDFGRPLDGISIVE